MPNNFNYNFLIKELAKLDTDYLFQLQDKVKNSTYTKVELSDWVLDISELDKNDIIFKKIFSDYIQNWFNIEAHVVTFVSRMDPLSYWPEHSVYDYEDEHYFEIVIPIISDNAALIYRHAEDMKSQVSCLQEGTLYVFDNIKIHSLANISTNYRYWIVSRWKLSGLVDKKFLDGTYEKQVVPLGKINSFYNFKYHFKYNFLLKELAKLEPNCLSFLQNEVKNLVYKKCDLPDWLMNVSNLDSDNLIFKKIFSDYIQNWFDIKAHVHTLVSRMNPFGYLSEHSDHWTHHGRQQIYNYEDDHHFKIIIPIISDNAALMWRHTEDTKSQISCLQEGTLYVFDNIKIHGAANLSPTYRYWIISRWKLSGLVDKKFLEAK